MDASGVSVESGKSVKGNVGGNHAHQNTQRVPQPPMLLTNFSQPKIAFHTNHLPSPYLRQTFGSDDHTLWGRANRHDAFEAVETSKEEGEEASCFTLSYYHE